MKEFELSTHETINVPFLTLIPSTMLNFIVDIVRAYDEFNYICFELNNVEKDVKSDTNLS